MAEPDQHTVARDQRDPGEDNVLEMRDISVTFDMDRGVSRVIDNVDLDLKRGEIMGIVGESGSGKSMLAATMLDAVVDPGQASGEITYYPKDGEPIEVLDLPKDELKRVRWEEISMVFQGAMSSFNPTMKIRGHFKETLDAHDVDREAGFKNAYRLLSDLHMDPKRVLNSYPHELSGGMKQRALLALSLLLEPEVLVMDEPTAALDLLMQRSILTLLEDIQEEYDVTLVFITHDLPLVTKLADRLAVLYAFEVVELGPTRKIGERAAHPYTRALLKSTPNIDAPLEEMRPIEGESPDPINIPTGCSYHERCPLADELCVESDPGREEIEPEHQAACFHWEESAEAIPLNYEIGGDGEGK
jgi:oligopeptide/dipeptide ABC transporter ATP-binding protein